MIGRPLHLGVSTNYGAILTSHSQPLPPNSILEPSARRHSFLGVSGAGIATLVVVAGNPGSCFRVAGSSRAQGTHLLGLAGGTGASSLKTKRKGSSGGAEFTQFELLAGSQKVVPLRPIPTPRT